MPTDRGNAMRLCEVEGCDHVHRALGLCQMHYKRTGRSPRTKYPRSCIACGTSFLSLRATGKFCTDTCKGNAYRTRSKLPTDHPVMMLIAEARAAAKRTAKPKPAPFSEDRECAWCGDAFTARIRTQVYCTSAHKIKAIRNRRRGREHGSTSHYTWAEVMRLYVGKFNRCCAYCEQPIDGQPEPDHVVPLSRGGSNSITNILPSCSLCNADKRDLLLHEWAEDRVRLGKPARVTTWTVGDQRYSHLTDALLAA